MESRIKGWISLIGGVCFLVTGLLLLEPVFIGLGAIMIPVTLWTFRLERRIKERYKRPAP